MKTIFLISVLFMCGVCLQGPGSICVGFCAPGVSKVSYTLGPKLTIPIISGQSDG